MSAYASILNRSLERIFLMPFMFTIKILNLVLDSVAQLVEGSILGHEHSSHNKSKEPLCFDLLAFSGFYKTHNQKCL